MFQIQRYNYKDTSIQDIRSRLGISRVRHQINFYPIIIRAHSIKSIFSTFKNTEPKPLKKSQKPKCCIYLTNCILRYDRTQDFIPLKATKRGHLIITVCYYLQARCRFGIPSQYLIFEIGYIQLHILRRYLCPPMGYRICTILVLMLLYLFMIKFIQGDQKN